MDNNIILKALYEQRKLIITQNYKILIEKTGFSQSYVYSVAHDIYPIFHLDYYQDIDLYKDFYKIGEEQLQNFIEYIDSFWVDDKKVGFYDLERKYGGRENRYDIIVMLRYCYLDGRFSGDEFWKYLMSNGPIECHSLTKDFDLIFDI